jgi:DNA polymerase III sliding clamp (beta) subunit (PCNA family)
MNLSKKLLHATKYASTNGIRPEINGVLIQHNKVVATDSYKLLELTTDAITSKLNKPIILELKSLKHFLKNHRKFETLTVISLSNNGMAQIQIDDGIHFHYIKVIDGTYPDYTQIMPNEKDLEYTDYYSKNSYNPKYLAVLMSVYDNDIAVDINHTHNMLYAINRNQTDYKAITLLMRMR